MCLHFRYGLCSVGLTQVYIDAVVVAKAVPQEKCNEDFATKKFHELRRAGAEYSNQFLMFYVGISVGGLIRHASN